MAASLCVASLSLEGLENIFRSDFFRTFGSSIEISLIILFGGCLAFLMLIAEFLLISETSVVTFSVAGIFKEIMTILLSAVIFGDNFTPLNILGLVISITGVGLYNYIRIQRMYIEKNKDTYMYLGSPNNGSADDIFSITDFPANEK